VGTVPTFALGAGFLGLGPHADGPVAVAGIPFDIGTTNRAGARFGPAAIRQASRMLVDGLHPLGQVEPGRVARDVGDFAIALGEVEASLRLIERQAASHAHLLALGGDHGVTLALLRAAARRQGRPLALAHFDAHVDTWPDSFGQRWGHGSVFFHAIEEGLVDPRRMIQIGIRSPVQREVWEWTLGKGVTVITAEQTHERGAASVADAIRATLGDAPAYLSFDIDALDPAFAPGTGTPEIGGLASWQAQAIMRRLGGVDWIGGDVVEVSPPYDVAEITALAAATIAWEYLALVAAAART
jgi:agmatinase